jgi:hypothetical protein
MHEGVACDKGWVVDELGRHTDIATGMWLKLLNSEAKASLFLSLDPAFSFEQWLWNCMVGGGSLVLITNHRFYSH